MFRLGACVSDIERGRLERLFVLLKVKINGKINTITWLLV